MIFIGSAIVMGVLLSQVVHETGGLHYGANLTLEVATVSFYIGLMYVFFFYASTSPPPAAKTDRHATATAHKCS